MHRLPWVRWCGVGFIIVWTLTPLYWALNISFQTDAQMSDIPANYVPPTPNLKNYATLLGGSGSISDAIRQATLNTVIECGAATLVTIVLATLAAYAFARMEFKGKTALFYTMLATMALPAVATLIPLYKLMASVGLVNTYTAVILVFIAGLLPLATWILYSYMTSLPVALEESAAIDGASRLRVLWSIVLPLARPGIVSTAIITFLSGWGYFLLPLVLTSDISTQPLTVVIASMQGKFTTPFTLLSAAGILALLVPAVITLILNRYIVNGLLAGSVK